MKRVVVTGIGIVSSIGANKEQVLASLKEGKSGISFNQTYADKGFRSHVCGDIDIDFAEHIDRKQLRFMSSAAAYTYIAMKECVADANLSEEQYSNARVGLVAGSGGSSTEMVCATADLIEEKGVKRVGPYMVTKTMSSTASACLATPFKIKGVNYSMSSACATSAHCIGHAMELIQLGKQEMVFAGGGEEVHWVQTGMFDAMGALSTKYNDTPEKASRAYDADRDGFVISGGGSMLVIEELEHAKARGAKIYGELVGYGATSDGYDMVAPSGEGAVRCMKMALDTCDIPVDYMNTHGTSTPVGDLKELGAMRELFGDDMPLTSSTKSLTGHALGAAGSNEAIYTLLMMDNDFIAASANIENLDPDAEGMPIVRETMLNKPVNAAISNSFGFGGTNASLVFKKYKD